MEPLAKGLEDKEVPLEMNKRALDYGYHYLEKFIRVPFHLPSVRQDKLDDFLTDILGTKEPANPPAQAKIPAAGLALPDTGPWITIPAAAWTYEQLAKMEAISLRWPLLLTEIEKTPDLINELLKATPPVKFARLPDFQKLLDLLREREKEPEYNLKELDLSIRYQVAPARPAPALETPAIVAPPSSLEPAAAPG